MYITGQIRPVNINKTHEAPTSPLLSTDCGNSTFAVPGPSAQPIPPTLEDTGGYWGLVHTPFAVTAAAAAVVVGIAAGVDIPGPPPP